MVVSFCKVENNSACSASTLANRLSELVVGGGDSGRIVRRVDREALRQATSTEAASSQLNVVEMISDHSSAEFAVKVPPSVEKVCKTG